MARPIASRLERRRIYAALRRALHLSLARDNFRIVHLAVLSTSIHLVVEADDKHALGRGMQGFQVSAARSLNHAARRTGTVFLDRYRMQILRTRLAVRAAIGALPRPAHQTSWPLTWLMRIELALQPARRWFPSRVDEDTG